MSQEDDALAKAFLDHTQMNEVRVYLEEGQRFKLATLDELNVAWILAFELVCAQGDASRTRELEDLGAELNLRGLAKPTHLVSEQSLKRVLQRIDDMSDQVRSAVESDVGEFLAELEKPKN